MILDANNYVYTYTCSLLSWKQLLDSNILTELLRHLTNGDTESASCIWKRHQVNNY